MKNKLLYVLIFSACCIDSNSQNWQWIKSAGSINSDNYYHSVRDKFNNVYSIGGSQPGGIFHFGSDTISIINNGLLIVKYKPDGQELWVKKLEQQSSAGPWGYISNLSYDPSDDALVVVGNFKDALYCDGLVGVTGGNDPNAFISKIDNGGNCLWTKSIPCAGTSQSFALDIDSSGNIFLSVEASTFALIDTNLISPGGSIIKLDRSGNVLWIKQIINLHWSSPALRIRDIKIKDDRIYLTGDASNTQVNLDTIQLNANGELGFIIASLDLSANAIWAKMYAKPNSKGGNNLSIDEHGNIYTVGTMYSSAHFDQDSLINSVYPNGYIAKFDSLGNYKWAHNLVSPIHGASVTACHVSEDGSTYFTGWFRNSISLNNCLAFGNGNDTTSFIARLDSGGNCLGVTSFGNAIGMSIVTLQDRSPVIVGQFTQSTTVGGLTIQSLGSWDMFIGRLDILTDVTNLERRINKSLLIYANPSQGKCTITVPDELFNENNLTLNIFDHNGKLVQQKNLVMHNGSIKVNLDQEARGIYHVSLSNGEKTYNGKIVFE